MGDGPSQTTKQISSEVRTILRGYDVRRMSEKPRVTLEKLEQHLTDARAYCVDYELSETQEERESNARQAIKWLKQAQSKIMTASQWDIFSPVDVAHLSAKIEQTIDQIRK